MILIQETHETGIRQVPGLSGYYATETGDIWSTRKGKSGKPRKIKPSPGGSGYLHFSYYLSDGRKTNVKVHCAVCSAFHGPRPNELTQIRHLNGDKMDNRPSNLRYGTTAENMLDRKLHGTWPSGSLSGNSKLTEQQVKEIVGLLLRKIPSHKIAEKYGIESSVIRAISSGKAWKHMTNKEITSKTRIHLTKQQIVDIREMCAAGKTTKEISLETGVRDWTVRSVKSGKHWKSVS